MLRNQGKGSKESNLFAQGLKLVLQHPTFFSMHLGKYFYFSHFRPALAKHILELGEFLDKEKAFFDRSLANFENEYKRDYEKLEQEYDQDYKDTYDGHISQGANTDEAEDLTHESLSHFNYFFVELDRSKDLLEDSLYKSMLFTLLSLMEFGLKKFSLILRTANNYQIGFEDLVNNNGYIHRYIKYLELVCQLDIQNLVPIITKIDKYRKVRNIVTHSYGEILFKNKPLRVLMMTEKAFRFEDGKNVFLITDQKYLVQLFALTADLFLEVLYAINYKEQYSTLKQELDKAMSLADIVKDQKTTTAIFVHTPMSISYEVAHDGQVLLSVAIKRKKRSNIKITITSTKQEYYEKMREYDYYMRKHIHPYFLLKMKSNNFSVKHELRSV